MASVHTELAGRPVHPRRSPDVTPACAPYRFRMSMTSTPSALHPRASVTLEAAANLVNLDTATIRRWTESGSIEVEWRGDMEVVRLDQVRAAASNHGRRRERGAALRERLDGASLGETLSVIDLQEQARERVHVHRGRRG